MLLASKPAVPREHRMPLFWATIHHLLPVEGMPASLGPGLRTVSGANRTRSTVTACRSTQ
jgi:hypothetical protein